MDDDRIAQPLGDVNVICIGVTVVLEGNGFNVHRANDERAFQEIVRVQDVHVVIFGGMPAGAIIEAIEHTYAPLLIDVKVIVLHDDVPDAFQELVQEDRVYYIAHASTPSVQLSNLIRAASKAYWIGKSRLRTDMAALSSERTLSLDFQLRLYDCRDAKDFAEALEKEASRLLTTSSVSYLWYDLYDDTLWTPERRNQEERRESASVGVVGYVARTLVGVRLADLQRDGRYEQLVDNPHEITNCSLIAEPVFDSQHRLLGVLSAVRPAASPFAESDTNCLQVLLGYSSPVLEAHDRRQRLRKLLQDETSKTALDTDIFRPESLEFHSKGQMHQGRLRLRLPRWLRYSYGLLIVFIGVTLAYAVFARVNEIATGPFLVRATHKVGVTSRIGGVVSSVMVDVGETVHEGDILLRLEGKPGDGLIERVKEELRSPVDGTVSEIAVRSGQQLAQDALALSIVDDAAPSELIALLPGNYAARLHAGMPMNLQIDGYPDALERVTIGDVAKEVIGPQEAQRFIGSESAEALSTSGPIVLVRARIVGNQFAANSQHYRYREGMTGQAHVAVRTTPLLVMLIPGLERIYHHPDLVFQDPADLMHGTE